MKQVVYYQKGYGNWHKRVDNISLLKYLQTQVVIYKKIIIPYYINKIKSLINK
jgi:hypothetical protein